MQVFHPRLFALVNLNGEAQLYNGILRMVSGLFVSANEMINFAQTCCGPVCLDGMLDADFLYEMNYAWEYERQTGWGIPGEQGCCCRFCQ